jgi:predicted SAM-dependent methyltransferase
MLASEDMVRLNLGCGTKLWPGYVNVDLPGSGAEVEADFRKLPFPDNHADEIHAIHVFEHLYRHEITTTLLEWKRVLKPEGRIFLELPSRDKVFYWIRTLPTVPEQVTLWAMYGDPSTVKSEADMHKWLWSEAEVIAALTSAGFSGIKSLEPKYHVKKRDMRIEAQKGNYEIQIKE